MNVTLIINYSKKRTTGGPPGVAYNTVEGLKKNSRRLEKEDIHIHILSTTGTILQSVFENDVASPNITFEYFRQIVPTSLTSDVNYFLHMKKMKSRVDLCHSHDISGSVVTTHLKIPTVLTLHGMVWKEKHYYPGIYSRFTFELNALRFKYVSQRLRKLIAISPYVISEVGSFLKTPVPETEVIENPISDVFFEQEKHEEEGLILYPASISSLKNQYALIKALQRLKKDNVRFHCILPGPVADPHYYRHLQSLIQKCELQGDISLPGNASLEQMVTLYSRASIMVLTSFQETAPLIISEAMATATPVIASRISGIPFMVSENNSGFLINPQDPAEIAEKIRILLDDKPMREKFGKESRKIALYRWKSEVITDKLLNTYVQARDQ
jgi:glycosyltransferase involved in cell wall biosynthesis